MQKEVCRAITFISYHIPMTGVSKNIEYTTLGFFDGMHTERLKLDYGCRGLDELWRYTIRCTAAAEGKHSYQNIFCFSDDSWNDWTDEDFWRQEQEDDEEQYPLTVVVFLQLQKYMYEEQGICNQCRAFKDTVKKVITSDRGKAYVYTTIDKNDFVVCIRCKAYVEAVNAIKELHKGGGQIIYSYSVVSVHNEVLSRLSENGRLGFLFGEENVLPSICLKGTVNSYDPTGNVHLEWRYADFYNKFVDRIYSGHKKDSRLYDILGDADFRLIAREVNLGRLLREYADGGLLSYKGKEFRTYFFSTSLILNTDACVDLKENRINIEEMSEQMEKDFTAPLCTALENKLEHIKTIVENGEESEKIITICYTVWQLLQSLKAMEMAPTKAYDFKSLYKPLANLVMVLEQKLGSGNSKDIVDLGENHQIFEYIHKFSMTLHSTLRTDIQFFQIRDFNAIVHYSPAKLRAFYWFWSVRLMEFYKSLSEEQREYSFTVAPGMFLGTRVQKMFQDETDASIRLMLITIPERHLYSPRWLMLILAHEISHYVGKDVRKRKKRHLVWRKSCARIFALEKTHYYYEAIQPDWRAAFLSTMSTPDYLFENMVKILDTVDRDSPCRDYHSPVSIETIAKAFEALCGDLMEAYVVNECNALFRGLEEYIQKKKLCRNRNELVLALYDGKRQLRDETMSLYKAFLTDIVSLLELLKYITAEAFADMMAIMTLKLTPAGYIESYSKTELNCKYILGDDRNVEMVLPYKIALVLTTISKVLNESGLGNCEQWKDIKDSWTAKALDELPEAYLECDDEQAIALKVWSIQKNICDFRQNTNEYHPILDYSKEFDGGVEADFLLDQVIWDELVGYLSECMNYYAEKLEEDAIKTKYEEIELIYKHVAGESFLDMIQEIETFLYTMCRDMD